MIDALAVALGLLLLVVGMLHFVVPGYFESLVPPWLPRHRTLVLVSGVVELVIGTGLLLEVSRSPAAFAASGLFVVYVLTHVDALVRATPNQPRWLDRPGGALVRVVVNLGYLAWSLVIALGA